MRRPASKPVAPSRWKGAILGLAFFALLLAVYWPALRGDFIWDDDAYVTNNPLLTAEDGWQRIWFSAHRQSQFFPLVFTTLRLEHAVWGLNPFGYHLVNVLLHAANAILVWLVLRALALPGAWIAAALFAFHPVHVESVAWVTELKNTQSTFFYLLALLMWIRFIRTEEATRWRDYSLTVLFYLLALLSKTTACTLPAALLLVPWMQGKPIDWRRIVQVMPFVILGIAAGVVSIWWEGHLGNYEAEVGQSLTLLQRTLIATRALWFYALKLMWPASLTFSYPPWEVDVKNLVAYLPLCGCLAVAFALWHWRRQSGRPAVAGLVFFVATLSPLLGFIPLYTFRYTYVADHYQYVASIGLLALAAAALIRAPRAIPFAVLAVLAGLAWKQTHIYQNQKALWQDTLAKNPASWMAHNNLGKVVQDQGDLDNAIHHFQQSIRLQADFAQARYNLGIVLFKTGETNQAMAQFEQAIRLAPRDSRAHYNLAIALDRSGRGQEAIGHYEEAIRLDPQYLDPRINLGILYSQLGRVDAAQGQFQEVVRLEPNHAEARNNLGAVLRAMGKANEAAEQFRATLRLQPNHALAQANLGAVLVQQGQLDAAIIHLQQAVKLDPSNSSARQELERAIQMKKDAK